MHKFKADALGLATSKARGRKPWGLQSQACLNLRFASFKDLAITTDDDLRQIAKILKIKLNYIGFSEDIKKIPQGFSIINLGDESMGGTHWTILFKKNNDIYYFDSYGIGPEDAIISDVSKNNGNLVYNKKQLQRSDGYFCGIWGLLWAKYFDMKNPIESMKKFSNKFDSVKA